MYSPKRLAKTSFSSVSDAQMASFVDANCKRLRSLSTLLAEGMRVTIWTMRWIKLSSLGRRFRLLLSDMRSAKLDLRTCLLK
jgi:hypothetical protein